MRTTGSAVLLSRLDELHNGLYGEELPALLMVRQWGDFGNVVAGIRGELEGLASDAAGFAPPGGSRRSAGGQGKRQGGRSASGRMTAAEAFRILGVPPTADAAKDQTGLPGTGHGLACRYERARER